MPATTPIAMISIGPKASVILDHMQQWFAWSE